MVLSDKKVAVFPFKSLRVIPYQPFSGIENMALDLWFSSIMAQTKIPIIRFYGWHPYCLSVGYHQKIDDIDMDKLKNDGFDIVRRPTGGSAIFHAEELTYSIIIPRENLAHHQLYEIFHVALVRALNQLGYNVILSSAARPGSYLNQGNETFACFNRAAKSEVKFEEKKVVGSAQKIFSDAILQHGSIVIGTKHEAIVSYLKVDDREKYAQQIYLKAHAISLAEINNIALKPCVLADKIIDVMSFSHKINNIFYKYTDDNELKLAKSFYNVVTINNFF